MSASRKAVLTVALVCSMALAQMAFVCNAGSVITQILTWLPAIEQAIVAVLNGVTILKGSTITVVDAEKIALYEQNATVTLNDLNMAVNAYKNSPAPDKLSKINAVYQSLASNEAALLPALHIVDPSTQAKVTAGFNLVGVGINVVGTLIAQLQPAPPPMTARAAHLMTVSQFKSQFNASMQSHVANPTVQAAFAGSTLK